MDPVTITLARKAYPVRPLTLGQLRRLSIGIRKAPPADPEAAEEWAFDQALDVIAAALERDHPEVTRAALLGLEATLPEMNAASLAILRLSGLVVAPKKGDGPGEAAMGEGRAGAKAGATSIGA